MIFRAEAYTGYFGIFNMVSHWRLRNMKLTSILVIFRVIFVNRVILVIFGHFWSFLVILGHFWSFWSFLVFLAYLFLEKRADFTILSDFRFQP
jgi:purine-cytosine permease-like protein